jgi:hypothetical protein
VICNRGPIIVRQKAIARLKFAGNPCTERFAPTIIKAASRTLIQRYMIIVFQKEASVASAPKVVPRYGKERKQRNVCSYITFFHGRCARSDRAGVGWTFSVSTQFTVPTGKRSERSRGMPLVTRMEELQANMRGIQWHPRV